MAWRAWTERRRRASARRVYDELRANLASACVGERPPALSDAAWAQHRRRFPGHAALAEPVGWAHETLGDLAPPTRTPPGYAAVRRRLARAHPALFPARAPEDGWDDGAVPDEADAWFWIGRAVPDGLLAAGAAAGLGRERILRDMAVALTGARRAR